MKVQIPLFKTDYVQSRTTQSCVTQQLWLTNSMGINFNSTPNFYVINKYLTEKNIFPLYLKFFTVHLNCPAIFFM